MARKYARLRIDAMASDEDFERLSVTAQWLYTRVLVPEPSLNYAGVADWRPPRLLRKAEGLTCDVLTLAALELEDQRFALFDVETEEVLVRSFIRSDELLSNPKMVPAVTRGYSETASRFLRAAIVTEVKRVRTESPEYSCWAHKTFGPELDGLCSRPDSTEVPHESGLVIESGADYQSDSVHIGNPHRSPSPIETPAVLGSVLPIDFGADSLAPNTHTSHQAPEGSKEPSAANTKARTKLSEKWAPTETHKTLAQSKGVNLDFEAEQFRLHAEATDRRMANWSSAFTMWLNKSTPRSGGVTSGRDGTTGRLWQE